MIGKITYRVRDLTPEESRNMKKKSQNKGLLGAVWLNPPGPKIIVKVLPVLNIIIIVIQDT